MPGPAVRRVVTGHDPSGKSNIEIDDVVSGERGSLVWTTDTVPANNTDPSDGGKRDLGIALKGGTVFWVIEIAPGGAPFMHRTHTVDYDIVLEGEVDMEMDDGSKVHLRQGDVIVQRGTNHAWVNRGDKACRLASVLIDAMPIEIDGRPLEAIS